MIILPNRKISHSKFLMPVLKKEWMTPSYTQQKTFCGNEDRTRFRVRARLNDGHVKWTGWFDDREDFDAFLYAIASGSLFYEKELWKLPNVEWHPDIGVDLTYDFLTQTILTTTGSNQTYTSPSDWNNSNNQIECLGGAASGGVGVGTSGHMTGGGGGAYSLISNFNFATPGTTTATYRVGAGGNAVSRSSAGYTSGNGGGSTWWNDTVDPGVGTDNTKCSADGGNGGAAGTGSRNGGTEGTTTASWGQTKYSGGRGGNLTGASGSGGSGGGGAAGPEGNGGNGGDSASTSFTVFTSGGSANNGATAGGAGGSSGSNGSSGTEFSASFGCGSGGGGAAPAVSSFTGWSGGNYGGGGGGCGALNSATSGAGRQGLIIVEYMPPSSAFLGNLPMLGM